MMDIMKIAAFNAELVMSFFEMEFTNKKLDELAEKIVAYAKEHRTIYFIGIGKNVPMLQKVVATMRSLSIKATIIDAVDILHGDFGIFEQDDIVICVSKSGTTPELVTTMQYLKERHMGNVYSVNMATEHAVEKISNEYLFSPYNNITLKDCIEADRWNKVPTTSPIVFQLIFDAIALSVANELGFTRNKFKNNHPGGKIGAVLGASTEKDTLIL